MQKKLYKVCLVVPYIPFFLYFFPIFLENFYVKIQLFKAYHILLET